MNPIKSTYLKYGIKTQSFPKYTSTLIPNNTLRTNTFIKITI